MARDLKQRARVEDKAERDETRRLAVGRCGASVYLQRQEIERSKESINLCSRADVYVCVCLLLVQPEAIFCYFVVSFLQAAVKKWVQRKAERSPR